MPRERILLSTVPPAPGLPLALRDSPWDHGWGPHRDGGAAPMVRSRTRWTTTEGEDQPVGP
eukprot:1759351-Lingulodinium_polyedra.AAC.1